MLVRQRTVDGYLSVRRQSVEGSRVWIREAESSRFGHLFELLMAEIGIAC